MSVATWLLWTPWGFPNSVASPPRTQTTFKVTESLKFQKTFQYHRVQPSVKHCRDPPALSSPLLPSPAGLELMPCLESSSALGTTEWFWQPKPRLGTEVQLFWVLQWCDHDCCTAVLGAHCDLSVGEVAQRQSKIPPVSYTQYLSVSFLFLPFCQTLLYLLLPLCFAWCKRK